jgi:hypothetical protein
MDKIGKRPEIKSVEDALKIIRKIAVDDRGHVLIQEHNDWLELKLKEIGKVALAGLKLKQT